MTFAEKLVFLMNLTSTSNKQLAAAAFVDPSFISLLRSARREAPKNMKLTRTIADYLARKCDGGYQRNALFETMGRRQPGTHISAEQLAAVLFDWLADGQSRADGLIDAREGFVFQGEGDAALLPSEGRGNGHTGVLYYGNEGKRAALDAFLSCLTALPQPETVLLTSDESLDWLTEAPAYVGRLRERVGLLLQKGFRLRRIAAPVYTTEQMLDTLPHFIPLYMSDQVESYYYPRLRDNVYRRTLLALPGTASLTSSSVGEHSVSRATVFTRDNRFTQALAGEFRDYLEKCQPVMNAYSMAEQPSEVLRCFERFEAEDGDRIQMSVSLSCITTPPELIPLALEGLPPEDAAAVADTLLRAGSLFRHSLDKHEAVDIHCLASAEDIREGRVPMAVSRFRREPPVCYTAKSYALHLKSILEYMRKYPGYRAVFRPRDGQTYAAMVKAGWRALLLRPGKALAVYEIRQPLVAEAFREHLNALSHKNTPPEAQRDGAMEWIRGMIRELDR